MGINQTGLFSPRQSFTIAKTFITHAALLRQGFPHCAIFPTAASRRSLGRVSVPVWLIVLSDQLTIVGLVSHYLTNYLMVRELIQWRQVRRSPPFPFTPAGAIDLCGISFPFEKLSPTIGQIIHALLTRAPLSPPKWFSFDLHVLGTPLAFVLSQDQTLQFNL